MGGLRRRAGTRPTRRRLSVVRCPIHGCDGLPFKAAEAAEGGTALPAAPQRGSGNPARKREKAGPDMIGPRLEDGPDSERVGQPNREEIDIRFANEIIRANVLELRELAAQRKPVREFVGDSRTKEDLFA